MTVASLDPKDLESVIQLQRTALPDDFLSRMGAEFLRDHYFPLLLGDPANLALGATEAGKLVGYVAFDRGGSTVRKLAERRPGALLKAIVLRAGSPTFLAQGLGVAKLLAFRKAPPEERGSELAFIAVDPGHQGKGIGGELVRRALPILKERGETYCWVKTLEKTPQNIRFYESLGFRIYQKSLGRVFLSLAV
jgi:ribosomal protein S18 acetylase RimI-like enzyme